MAITLGSIAAGRRQEACIVLSNFILSTSVRQRELTGRVWGFFR